jgi:hypothetical protein
MFSCLQSIHPLLVKSATFPILVHPKDDSKSNSLVEYEGIETNSKQITQNCGFGTPSQRTLRATQPPDKNKEKQITWK